MTLITGPVSLSDPAGAEVIHVGSAREMQEAVEAALPADAFIAAAAVADWRSESVARQKIKKGAKESPTLRLVENPDILAEVSKKTTMRPAVVIGFAAETENVTANAKAKLRRKGCDLIIANSVGEGTSTFGGETNQVEVIDARSARILAADDQSRGRRPHRSPPRARIGETPMITIVYRRFSHAEGLQMPAYESEDAAGMDLLAAVPAGEGVVLAPWVARVDRDRVGD